METGMRRKEYKPYDYQRYAENWIIQKPCCGLFLEMGLGKTVITLSALKDLKFNRFKINKTLVIAPKRVAEASWSDEAAKWEHLRGYRVSIVLGTANERKRAIAKRADLYVTNRDSVVWLVEHYGKIWPFDCVVLDESSSFKNHRSKRFRALKSVRKKINRMILLTGTPAPKSLLDLWAQIFLLDSGKRLGRTFSSFRDFYFVPDKRSRERVFTYKPRSIAQEAITEKLKDICLSMKSEDFLELPEKQIIRVPVILSGETKKQYKKLEKEMLLQVGDEEITASTQAVLSSKLLQLCNGAVYSTDERGERKTIRVHQKKLETLLEILEFLTVNGQKHALVFYEFQSDKECILKALSATKLKCATLDNATSVHMWNTGKIDVLLAHPASCAYGLNLQSGGNHIIWYGLPWNPELFEQSNKRLHRMGQKNTVFIHVLLVKDSRDEDVFSALKAEGECQDRLIESLKARVNKAKKE